jgi:hypothetical protein
MTKTTTVLLMIGALSLAGRTSVGAQTLSAPPTQAFVNVSVGVQPQSRTLNAVETFSLFDEDAKVSAAHKINSGAFFEIGAGYRVWRSLAVGLALSSFGSKGDATGTASIPDPVFADRPTIVPLQGHDMKHTERGIHLQATWFYPVTEKMDVAFSVGPSFIRVSQQLLTTANQSAVIALDTQKGTAKGVNIGVDGTYMLTDRVGVGLLIRYAGGSVDLPSAANVKAGGFQLGIGARIRF